MSPRLDWYEGNINTKQPDRALLGKMLDIAAKLGANVQGDDSEVYAGIGRNDFSARPGIALCSFVSEPARHGSSRPRGSGSCS